MKRILFLFTALTFFIFDADAQLLVQKPVYAHADSLRGGITKERMWWDALHYDLAVKFDIPKKSIEGCNIITYKVLFPYQTMQIDLIEPLKIDSIMQNRFKLNYRKDGNSYFVELREEQFIFEINQIEIYYSGIPHEAKNAPWDGGVSWKKDAENNPWVSVSCQGIGASIWYPNKDHQYDEPDSATMHFAVPEGLDVISNGRHLGNTDNHNGYVTHTWHVSNPISNYTIIPYIGKYGHKHETYKGLNGDLDVDLYFLGYNMQQANDHVLPDLLKSIEAFEYWFGPYPFYADGFKMVEAPYLGMEHQSAIAYGNRFKKGYLGFDMSGTGIGMKWDYIVVHESAHEWFGNNITTKDIADMWVHEGFGNYAEVLFTDYWYGSEYGNNYLQGVRTSISNDKPVIGPYNVNEEGSSDMYPKGAALVHNIRRIIQNDSIFRSILVGLNSEFYHGVVRSEQIERYISERAGIDLSKTFDQYLRTTMIPQLEYKIVREKKKSTLIYRWTNCVEGFDMPVKVKINNKWVMIYPTDVWSSIPLGFNDEIAANEFIDNNFYVTAIRVE